MLDGLVLLGGESNKSLDHLKVNLKKGDLVVMDNRSNTLVTEKLII